MGEWFCVGLTGGCCLPGIICRMLSGEGRVSGAFGATGRDQIL